MVERRTHIVLLTPHRMENVSFLGLSGSGKSCYIYAMSHAMLEGVKFPDKSVLSVTCATMAQMSKMHKAFMQMAQGTWPIGTAETTYYNYVSRIKLKRVMDFQLQDYRGGLLDSEDEDDEEERRKLFESFDGACTLLFFIGADTVLKAMDGNFLEDYKIGKLGIVYEEYLEEKDNAETPIMIIISKADMIPAERMDEAKEYVRNKLQGIFGAGTGLTVALTTISLGKGLSNNDGELEGQLIVKPTSGNIHIPILFSLYCVMAKRMEQTTSRLDSARTELSSGQTALRHERKRNFFTRIFFSNEKSIASAIENANQDVANEKANLDNCLETLSKIKAMLLNTDNVELYIDGEKQ